MIANKRLLILDDEIDVARTIGYIAEKAGFSVRCCAVASEFFSEVEQWAPSHIAIDLVMPQVDGVEVLRHLADQQCRARIIVTSGIGAKVLESARRSASDRGLDIVGILPKPFKPQLVRELLGAAHGTVNRRAGKGHGGYPLLQPEDFDRALLERQFLLHYQPKVRLSDGGVMGFEALIRWRHPEAGMILPDSFISAAEACGKLDEISLHIVRIGLDWLKMVRARHDIVLEFNMSARSLRDIRLPDVLAEECDRRHLDRSTVAIEITESSAVQDIAEASDVLTRFRIKGFQVAIDDFGIGYSSLEQLSTLPFSELKIDKIFVFPLTRSDEARAVVESTVRLAKRLGLMTVAEGVENQQTIDLLAEMGCDAVQGFHISRPMPGPQAFNWMDHYTGRDSGTNAAYS